MFSNVRFLTMEEIIFAALNAKRKPKKNPEKIILYQITACSILKN